MIRIAEWARQWGVQTIPFNELGTPSAGDTIYRIKDIFTTRDGSWEVSNKPGSIEQWARDEYLTAQFDDAGADHHIFGRMNHAIGTFVPGGRIRYWTYSDNGNASTPSVKRHSGWANIVMYPSSSFVPSRGERGPWAWCPDVPYADVVTGAGMPQNWHVSWFAVWQAKVYQPDVVDPPIDPDRPTDDAILAQLHENTMAINDMAMSQARIVAWQKKIIARLEQFDGEL